MEGSISSRLDALESQFGEDAPGCGGKSRLVAKELNQHACRPGEQCRRELLEELGA
jgi:hypothetical protein